MVAEHSHNKMARFCAAISKKKRKKLTFSSNIRENFLKTKKIKKNSAKKIKTKEKKRTWKNQKKREKQKKTKDEK